MPKALKSCPTSNKAPNLVTLIRLYSFLSILTQLLASSISISFYLSRMNTFTSPSSLTFVRFSSSSFYSQEKCSAEEKQDLKHFAMNFQKFQIVEKASVAIFYFVPRFVPRFCNRSILRYNVGLKLAYQSKFPDKKNTKEKQFPSFGKFWQYGRQLLHPTSEREIERKKNKQKSIFQNLIF